MDNSHVCFEINFNQGCYSNLLELLDGTLHTEDGGSFDIHRFMLSRSSDYFYAMFCGMGKGRKNVVIPGIRGDILRDILTYIYTHNLCITKENVCDLLVAADYLLMDELVMDIRRQLTCHISVSNCLSLFVAATQMNLSDIQQESYRIIQMNFEAIVEDDDSEISILSLDALNKVLSDKNLNLTDENTVWLAIVKWIQADASNRRFQVPDLLMHLAIPDVDEPLASRILEHTIVADNPFCHEINQMKMANIFTTNTEIILHYFRNRLQSSLFLDRSRQPTHLNFVAHYCKENETCYTQIYVTYDENIDMWRKITDIDMWPDFLATLGSNIYAFRKHENKMQCFNLVERAWIEITNTRLSRLSFYQFVNLQGMIYVLGGYESEGVTSKVEVYDPERNIWSEVAPMIPATVMSVVTHRKCIYVIGNSPRSTNFSVMAQVYNQETNTWLKLQSPRFLRYNFAVIVYRERIFVLGGRNTMRRSKAVEVFDPSKGKWTSEKGLPYLYDNPKAIVLYDNLIVYDNCLNYRTDLKVNPPVKWNDGLARWIPVEPASPLNNLHRYHFFTLDNTEWIRNISRESRDPTANFQKSPFN